MSLSCDADYGAPEFFTSKEVKARKTHHCCECGETIEIGATYQRAAGKWEGEFLQFKTCERCGDLRDSYLALGYCVEYQTLWSGHLEFLEESGEGDSPAASKARQILMTKIHFDRQQP